MTRAPEELLARLGSLSPDEAAGFLAPLGDEEWGALVDAAIRHGLGPLLALELRALPASLRIPEHSARRLEDLYLYSALRSRSLQNQLAEILGLLRSAGVETVVLKGAHLAGTVYPDPAARPMSDLDLLVREEAVPVAFQALIDAGYATDPRNDEKLDYATHHHCSPLVRAGRVPVEIHRRLLTAGPPLRQDIAGIWDRIRPVRVAGLDAWVLSPEDLVIHLSLHAGWNHGFDIPILALCDLARCVRHYRSEIDWRALRAIAERDGGWPVVGAVLDLVRSETGAAVPMDVCPPLDDGEARELLRRHLLRGEVAPLPVAYKTFHHAGDAPGRARALLAAVFPPSRVMRKIYGVAEGRMVAPFYLVRPFDLLLRRGRVAWKMLTRDRDVAPALEREVDRKAVREWLERPPD